MMHRLPETQRNADKITQEERSNTKEQRNRETARNHVPHGEPVGVTGAQIQVQNVPEPRQVTLPGGLVKTEVRLDLRNLVGRERLGRIYPALHGSGLLRTRNHLLHRSTRQQLDKDKAYQ